MSVTDVTSVTVGVLGVLFGLHSYRELFKWARQCQNARIAVSFKRKVQLNAPLVEWLQWANQLEHDETTTGRVVYRNRDVSVALLRPPSSQRVRTALKRIRTARTRNRTPAG